MSSPARRSASQSAGRACAPQRRPKAAGDRLDRRQRIVEFVTQDAHQPLPGLEFLLPKGLAQIGDHHQLMRAATLAKLAAPHAPPRVGAGNRGRSQEPARLALERLGQADRGRRPAQQAFPGLGQKPLARPVDQPQDPLLIEGEDRNVDFLHHRAQERGRLDRVRGAATAGRTPSC